MAPLTMEKMVSTKAENWIRFWILKDEKLKELTEREVTAEQDDV